MPNSVVLVKAEETGASFEAPKGYICALSECVMVHPVSSPAGVFFELSAIKEHLQGHNTCPVTQSPLTVNELYPNRLLAHHLQSWRRKHGLSTDAVVRKAKPCLPTVKQFNGQTTIEDYPNMKKFNRRKADPLASSNHERSRRIMPHVGGRSRGLGGSVGSRWNYFERRGYSNMGTD